jgi:hypothetical protein
MPVKKYQDPFAPKAQPPREVVVSKKTLKVSEKTRAEPESSKPVPKYSREYLKDNWNQLSGRIITWLTEGDRLEILLSESKIKDVGVFAGIALDKTLLLDGSPTQIIGHAEQKKLDELLPALLNEVKRRGTMVELTERKAVVSLNTHEPRPLNS